MRRFSLSLILNLTLDAFIFATESIINQNSSSKKVLLKIKVNDYVYKLHHEKNNKIDNSKYVIKIIKDQKSGLSENERDD